MFVGTEHCGAVAVAEDAAADLLGLDSACAGSARAGAARGAGAGGAVSWLDEAGAVLALAEAAGHSLPGLGRLLAGAGSAAAVLAGSTEVGPKERAALGRLVARIGPGVVDHWRSVVAGTLRASPATRLVTVTDPAYPSILLELERPPVFLFVRGEIDPGDCRAVAVVGSRQASDRYLDLACEVSAELVSAGVTVVSGLASGIDTAAHLGALRRGGRTLAVVPAGLDRIYPSENRGLAAAVSASGALLSRSWPDAPPNSRSFRLRNEVTSGLALATVVVEAGPAGGTRMQARIALEQHRRVVLLQHLVRREAWARRMASRHGVAVAAGPAEVVAAVGDLLGGRARQLSLF